jgi:hypothetical protein
MSLSACDNCPPRLGVGGCFEKLVGTIQVSASYDNQQISFGNMPPGRYWARYCSGAFYSYLDGAPVIDPTLPNYPFDPRLFPQGYWTANPVYIEESGWFLAYTAFVYQNPDPGETAGIIGSPVGTFGTVIFPDIANSSLGGYSEQVGSALTEPVYEPNSDGAAGTSTYFATLSQVEQWSQCGKAFMVHYGGDIYLATGFMPNLTGETNLGGKTFSNISGAVTWGLYQVTPTFFSDGFVINETDTTTTAGANDWTSGYDSITPAPNVTTATFTFSNAGELAYTGVTVTLSGASSASAPQTVDLPLGTTSLTFSFETPASAVTAVLSFTDAVGETFPTVSYDFAEFLIVNTPTAAADPSCPGLTIFTFPVKNVGTLTSGSGTRVDIGWWGGSNGVNPGNTLSAIYPCSTAGSPPNKTMILGAIAAGATANAFIECANQPSGTISEWKIMLSGSGLSAVPPAYYFTYTWP